MDEDFFYYEAPNHCLTREVVIEDEPEPIFTGLYAADGSRICRVVIPRPSPKFVHFDPSEAELYDYDVSATYYEFFSPMETELPCQKLSKTHCGKNTA